MKKHQEAAQVDEHLHAGKPVFRRKRTKELKAVEEVLVDRLWRARDTYDSDYKGPVRFRIVGLYVAGRRVQRFFNSKTEAATFMEEQTVRQGNLGARAAHVDGRLVEDAVECDAMVKANGLRLLDVVRDYMAARAHLKAFPHVPLEEAAQHYGALLADRAKSWTVNEAADIWLAGREKKDRSDGYLRDAKRRLKQFRETYGKASMADITTEQIDAWVNGLGERPGSGHAVGAQLLYCAVFPVQLCREEEAQPQQSRGGCGTPRRGAR